MNTKNLPADAIKTLIQVLREAKGRMRHELASTGSISTASREAYSVALVAFGGDRVLESIEALITIQDDAETTGRIDMLMRNYVEGIK